MSKAFTREDDELPEPALVRRPVSTLPPGAKNYLTPDGARRLREMLEHLVSVERPQAASNPLDARSRLQALDDRIQHLRQSLRTAVVMKPPAGIPDQVRFGATVTVRSSDGVVSRYRIVGADETDFDRGWVSWLSPIARALLNARKGDRVGFQSPSGEVQFEILDVTYE